MLHKPKTWRDGVVVPYRDWHFLRNLYTRFRIVLQPGEFLYILRLIESGALVPLPLKYKKFSTVRVYRYVRYHPLMDMPIPIYIVADPETKTLISAYKSSWVARFETTSQSLL